MYTGFRYAGIYGCEDVPEPVAHRIHSDITNASGFECSDSEINAVCETARRSFISNLVNIPTDCPERERRGRGGAEAAPLFVSCRPSQRLSFRGRSYSHWQRTV